MKYEALKVEIVRIDEEDILTLSNLNNENGNAKVVDWGNLWAKSEFVD